MAIDAIDGKLLAVLLALLAAAQGGCWCLARGLGVRLERHALALGVLLPLLFLSPWLDRSRLLVPSDVLEDLVPGAPVIPRSARYDLLNDPVLQFLPWELEIRHALRERHLPLWSDTLDGGSSPWVNPAAAACSPFSMAARAFPIQHHLLVILALAVSVAFAGTWVLGRVVGLRRPARLLAAAGFCLGGGMMSWALFPHTATAAWIPWLVAGTVRLVRLGGGPRALVTTAGITTAMVLSGHPEVAAVGGLFAAVCGLSLPARRRRLIRGAGAAALAGILGLGLAAPVVLPFLAVLPRSARALETLAQAPPAFRFEAAVPRTWFVAGHAGFMLAPANPHAFGRPFVDPFEGPVNWVDADSGYAGLVAFAGAWIALVSRRRRRRALPFLSFALVSLLLAAGFLPAAWLVHSVPPLRTMAYARFLIVGCLALAMAGAIGLDALLRGRRRPAAVVLAVALAAGISLTVRADPWVACLWLLLAGAALAALRWPRPAAALLGLVLLLDLVPWSQGLLPRGRPELFYPATQPLAALHSEIESPGGPWRAVGAGYTARPSLLPVYGIAEVRPHNALAPQGYLDVLDAAFGYRPTMSDYFGAFRHLDRPFLDFLNARGVIARAADPIPATMERIDGGRFGSVRLYRNTDALPRWFIPSGVDVIRRGELKAWVAALRDPRRVAIFAPDVKGWAHLAPVAGASVSAETIHPGSIALRVTTPLPSLVATSLGWPQGWRANANGEPLRTLVVNGAFLGIEVPAGMTHAELRFVPPGLYSGVALAVAAFLVCAALFLVPLRRGRLAPRRPRLLSR